MAAQAQTATRKQLDELDALLQKMLGQPASSPGDGPIPRNGAADSTIGQAATPNSPPRPPQFPPAAVAYGVPPAVAFAASSPTGATAATEKRPGWSIDLNPKDGSSVLANRTANAAVTPQQQPTNDRPSPIGLLSVTTIPAPVADSVATPMPSAIVTAAYDVPTVLRPVAWVNDRCDAALRLLGPIGRVFTSPGGRTLMGYVGLAMLAASVASGALAWIGWSW
jgi:hypothetical protein